MQVQWRLFCKIIKSQNLKLNAIKLFWVKSYRIIFLKLIRIEIINLTLLDLDENFPKIWERNKIEFSFEKFLPKVPRADFHDKWSELFRACWFKIWCDNHPMEITPTEFKEESCTAFHFIIITSRSAKSNTLY